MVEVVGHAMERAAAKREAGTQGPLRIGAAQGISEGELLGILDSQSVRTAGAGGGGFKGPGRKAPPASAEGGEPHDSFFHVSGLDEAAGIGYVRRSRSGDLVTLKVTGRGAGSSESLINTRVNWAEATVKALDETPPASGERTGMNALGFELRVPLRAQPSESLAVRVITFFRKLLSPEDPTQLRSTIEDSVKKSGRMREGDFLDGILELKKELRNQVDDLEFHIKQGADDLTIVRQDDVPHELAF